MTFDNSVAMPGLKTTAPGHQPPAKAISFIADPTTPRVEIDLKAFAREGNLPLNIAAQYAIGRVVDFIRNDNEGRVDIHCGNPNATGLGGFRYTAEARQAQNDVRDLISPLTIQTIQDQTGQYICMKRFNDPISGNPVISYVVG